MDSPVEFPDVELVRQTDFAFIFRVRGREVSIPPLQIQPGTTAQRIGQRGTLVIPKWLAKDLGLEVAFRRSG